MILQMYIEANRNAFEVVKIGRGMYTNLPSVEVVG